MFFVFNNVFINQVNTVRCILIVVISLSYNKQRRQKGRGENPALAIPARQGAEKWKEGKEDSRQSGH